MQKTSYSSPEVAAVDREVQDLLEKQALGYMLIAYVGRKSYVAKRVMGCGDAIWFTPRGRQWRKADRIEAVRPHVPQAENVWEQDERPCNFRRTIRRPEWMSRHVDENTTAEDWLEDWDCYSTQYDD